MVATTLLGMQKLVQVLYVYHRGTRVISYAARVPIEACCLGGIFTQIYGLKIFNKRIF
jgi:hypothetical protein